MTISIRSLPLRAQSLAKTVDEGGLLVVNFSPRFRRASAEGASDATGR
jgi:hypothetical protein